MRTLVRAGSKQLLIWNDNFLSSHSRNQCDSAQSHLSSVKDTGINNLNVRKCLVRNPCENICLTCQMILALDLFSYIKVVSI